MLKHSFSLIEVVIFVAILGFFFVVAASVATSSLRNMQINEHKVTASHYARQLEEWLRSEKEREWGGLASVGSCSGSGADRTFTENVTCTPNKYCFNSQTISDWTTPGACPSGSFGLDSFYNRQVDFSTTGTPISQVASTITLSWKELGADYSVVSRTVYSVLE